MKGLGAILQPGAVFAGRCRIEELIGGGGFSQVYRVTHLETARTRALKVLHQHALRADPKAMEHWRREVRVAQLVDSEHVVDVLDAGIHRELRITGPHDQVQEEEIPYILMEFLRGEDFRRVLARRGALPRDEVLLIFEQLCHVLQKAHRAGVIHRDLKPENIFLTISNRWDNSAIVKVVDFGIATVMDSALGEIENSTTLGSPKYMAPEQVFRGGRVGPFTDIWALGMLAFRMLTGVDYWGDVAPGVVYAQLAGSGEFPAAHIQARELHVQDRLPDDFGAWFRRCVARDPAGRFASVEDCIHSLRMLLTPDLDSQTFTLPNDL